MGLFDIFKKPKKEITGSLDIFKTFLRRFEPSENLVKPTADVLDWYRDKLPEDLLYFWTQYGFGNYGKGLLKIVEPSGYMDSFYTWLGKEDFSKLPVLVTAFGDIFYYRKLADENEDVSLLDIHYRQINVCDYSLSGFFEDYIVEEEIINKVLRKSLFEESVDKLGLLNDEEIFYFQPALIAGGAEEIKYIDKGSASVHQLVLFQMG